MSSVRLLSDYAKGIMLQGVCFLHMVVPASFLRNHTIPRRRKHSLSDLLMTCESVS